MLPGSSPSRCTHLKHTCPRHAFPRAQYSGPALSAFAQFVWTAEVTVVGGATSDAAESFFETGPITSADWHNASWLTAAAGRPNQYRFECPPSFESDCPPP